MFEWVSAGRRITSVTKMDPKERTINYRIFERPIGEGTYSIVFKAQNLNNGVYHAVKQIKGNVTKHGIPYTTLREISVLKSLKHPNIINLQDVEIRDNKLHMYFDFVEQDLGRFLQNQRTIAKLDVTQVKSFLHQILLALDYMHCNGIMHRDLKPENILIQENVIKIADFGLSKMFSQSRKVFTHEVVTLLYRSPELLLGEKCYSFSIDVWSVGCIFAEMITFNPVIYGTSEVEMIKSIFEILGTPSEDVWHSISKLPFYQPLFPKFKPTSLKNLLPTLDSDGLDLLQKMWILDPTLRITAKDALKHAFFKDV